MPKFKQKNESQKSFKALPFALVWTLASLLAALATPAFWLTNPTSYLTLEQIEILFLLRAAPLTALFQVFLVERFFKRSMRGWMLYTLLATLVTLLINPPVISAALMLFAPTAVLQTIWLWRRVNRAWLWPIFSGNSGMALYFLLSFKIRSQILQLGIPVIWAFIAGFVMHSLLAQSKDTEKAKVDFASDDEETRIERLQERENSNPLWDRGDDQALQSEA